MARRGLALFVVDAEARLNVAGQHPADTFRGLLDSMRRRSPLRRTEQNEVSRDRPDFWRRPTPTLERRDIDTSRTFQI